METLSIHLSVQMYHLELQQSYLILWMCQLHRYSTRLRPMGHNSHQNMLLKLLIQIFTIRWCVLLNLFAHPIADMKLHLSKNNDSILKKSTFEFVHLVPDNSVSWSHSLEAVNFWISRIPNLWNRQQISPILAVS